MAAKPSINKRSWRYRLAVEQLVQMLIVLVSILDRIVLAALFYRFWGAAYFEAWSVVLAIVSLMSFSQFGFVSYYQNTITELLQKGQKSKAIQLFRESFTLLSVTSLTGVICLTAYTVFFVEIDFDSAGLERANILMIATIMFVAAAAKIPVSSIEALYRASRQYSIYAGILLSGDLLRIVLVGATIIFLNENLLFPALAVLFAITSVQAGYLLHHKSIRFPEFSYGISFPNCVDLRYAFAPSSGFFLNTLATVLLASLPVLMLNAQAEETGHLSAFLITRILFGLPRILSQATSIVIGHEASRHITEANYTKAWVPVTESSKVVAVVSGIIVGCLICFEQDFTVVWLGDSDIFQMDLALAAALPALILPAATIANNVLMTANKAYAAAVARVAQLILFVGMYAILPKMNPVLAMFLALGLSEVLGFALIAKILCYRHLKIRDASFFFADTLLAIASAAVIILLNWMLMELSLNFSIRLALSAVMGVLLFYYLALDKTQRSALLQEVLT